tara:strand:- start:389 stop:1123 length:735 start_codon:yes stop_codon:yes gene_type:complete
LEDQFLGGGKMRITTNKSNKPYKERALNENTFIREFSKQISPKKLVWHRDAEKRTITVIKGAGWQFQRDNKIPVTLNEGDQIKVEAGEYHRLIKGNTDLFVSIVKGKSKLKEFRSAGNDAYFDTNSFFKDELDTDPEEDYYYIFNEGQKTKIPQYIIDSMNSVYKKFMIIASTPGRIHLLLDDPNSDDAMISEAIAAFQSLAEFLSLSSYPKELDIKHSTKNMDLEKTASFSYSICFMIFINNE